MRVEPICRALQVAPWAYRRHAARQRNPALLPPRAQRDAQLLAQVQRMYDQNLRVKTAGGHLHALDRRQAQGSGGCEAAAVQFEGTRVALTRSFVWKHKDGAAVRAAGLPKVPNAAPRLQAGRPTCQKALRTWQRTAGSLQGAGPSTLPIADHRWRCPFRLQVTQQFVVHAFDRHVRPFALERRCEGTPGAVSRPMVHPLLARPGFAACWSRSTWTSRSLSELRLACSRSIVHPPHRLLLSVSDRLRLGAIREFFRVVWQPRLFRIRWGAYKNDDGLIAAAHGLGAQLESKATVFK
ncbi:hypothetical protein [Variovorax sp. DT-64]|uniref:hypothetical protein n=1 Tax=Variovorax sp. DT-64 TaxID=3396160 RepID=UPI003F1B3C09